MSLEGNDVGFLIVNNFCFVCEQRKTNYSCDNGHFFGGWLKGLSVCLNGTDRTALLVERDDQLFAAHGIGYLFHSL